MSRLLHIWQLFACASGKPLLRWCTHAGRDPAAAMARKKIREYDSKRLLKAHIKRLKGVELPLNVAQVLIMPGGCQQRSAPVPARLSEEPLRSRCGRTQTSSSCWTPTHG